MCSQEECIFCCCGWRDLQLSVRFNIVFKSSISFMILHIILPILESGSISIISNFPFFPLNLSVLFYVFWSSVARGGIYYYLSRTHFLQILTLISLFLLDFYSGITLLKKFFMIRLLLDDRATAMTPATRPCFIICQILSIVPKSSSQYVIFSYCCPPSHLKI